CIAQHWIAVSGDKLVFTVKLEIAGPRQKLLVSLLYDEKTVAADGHVELSASVAQRALREVGFGFLELHATAEVVDGPRPRLIQPLLIRFGEAGAEQRQIAFERSRVDVGQIIGQHFESLIQRVSAFGGDVESVRHGWTRGNRVCPPACEPSLLPPAQGKPRAGGALVAELCRAHCANAKNTRDR